MRADASAQQLPAPCALTTEQAAAYVNVAPKTLCEYRRLGCGPVYARLGGQRNVRYLVQDLDAWLATRRHTSTSAETFRSSAAA